MQAALSAARNGQEALFIDAEGTFRPERVEGIARARGWDVEGVLERIVYLRVDSSAEQNEAVREMAKRKATAHCRLVVVDTLTRNFSLDLPGSANMPGRQQALDVHLSEMARDAYINERAYVLTNRVTFGPGDTEVGVGGRTVTQLLHDSILLRKEGDIVRARSVGREKECELSIGAAGID